jgi:hypothetical protein
MIFSTSEPAQYVVVWPGSCKVKDISYIATIAIPSNLQITGLFQEKAQFCYLLFCNSNSRLNVVISIPYPNSISLLFPAKSTLTGVSGISQ